MKSSVETLAFGVAMLGAGLAIGTSLPGQGSAFAAATPMAAPQDKPLIPKAQHLWILEEADIAGAREKVTDAQWQEHLDYDVTRETSGGLFLGGAVSDETGKREYGMFIFRAKDAADAHRIANEDPAIKLGLRTVKIHQYEVHQGKMTFSVDFSDGAAAFR